MLDFLRLGHVEPHAFHTYNHPTRLVLDELVARMHAALALPFEPGRTPAAEPLGRRRLPLEAPVLKARCFEVQSRPDWLVRGQIRRREDVAMAHLDFYRRHPETLSAGLEEHADRLRAFDLTVDPGA